MAAFYHVWLRDTAGAKLAVLTHFLELAYTKRVNAPGSYALTLGGADPKIAHFGTDVQVEVWRFDQANDITAYIDFGGFHRYAGRGYDERGQEHFLSRGPGYMELLGRRIIYAAHGAAGADKTGAAETIAKAFANEQAGPGAGARALAGLSIQADAAAGPAVRFSRAYRNLLEVLQEITDVGQGDMDVVSTGAALWEFRWYNGQLGTDRTWGNPAGNAPVQFAPELGNMATPAYEMDRTQEATACYVGGQGTGAGRTVVVRTTAAAILESPWNRREIWRDAQNETLAAGLNAKGDRYLWEQQAKENFGFRCLQTPACLYGKHYALGDLITARYGNVTVNKKVIGVSVSVKAGDSQVETIDVELGDV